MVTVIEWILWLSLTMVLRVTAGYPALLALSSPFAKRTRVVHPSQRDVMNCSRCIDGTQAVSAAIRQP
jgi:hypothetical protein